MSKIGKHYKWDKENPPEFDEHSKHKHKLLSEYLQAYCAKRTTHLMRSSLKLTIVDGFCGGGAYQKNGQVYSGSPLVILEALIKSEQIIENRRKENLTKTKQPEFKINAELYFIDSDKHAIEMLREIIHEKNYPEHYQMHFITGEFDNVYKNEIRKRISKKSSALFILDQYGYSNVDVMNIKDIFNTYSKPEVFWTWNFGNILDRRLYKNLSDKTLKRGGLSKKSILEHMEILDAAQISNKDIVMRTVQRLMANDIISVVGAKRYSPYIIEGDKSSSKYFFIHLATEIAAREVFRQVLDENENEAYCTGTDPGLMFFSTRYDHKTQRLPLGKEGIDHMKEYCMDDLIKLLRDKHLDGISLNEANSLYLDKSNLTTNGFKQTISYALSKNQIQVQTPSGQKKRLKDSFQKTTYDGNERLSIPIQPSFYFPK